MKSGVRQHGGYCLFSSGALELDFEQFVAAHEREMDFGVGLPHGEFLHQAAARLDHLVIDEKHESSGLTPALAAADRATFVDERRGRPSTSGIRTSPRRSSVSGLSGFLGFDFSGSTGGLPVRMASIDVTNSLVGIAKLSQMLFFEYRELFAEHAEQMPFEIGQGAAGAPGLFVIASSTYIGP